MSAISIQDANGARRFLNGPCAKAAREIIEEIGVLNLIPDHEDEICALVEDGEPEVFGLMTALIQGPDDNRRTVEMDTLNKIDDAILEALRERGARAYLLGLAVGLRLGPGFLKGGGK